jgi:hypothetical protein
MIEEKAAEKEVVAGIQRQRGRGTIGKAVFIVCFFGSLAARHYLLTDAKMEIAWLFLFIGWAVLIRWWMVAGLLIGILCYTPQLHVFEIRRRIVYMVIGASAGLVCEFLEAYGRRRRCGKSDGNNK